MANTIPPGGLRPSSKWKDRLGELGKRVQDLLRDLAGGSPPEPALVPVRVRVPRP